ncbi:MAG TPA: hypothetical protein VIN75_25560 [Burkholderiaceae bacterium]
MSAASNSEAGAAVGSSPRVVSQIKFFIRPGIEREIRFHHFIEQFERYVPNEIGHALRSALWPGESFY